MENRNNKFIKASESQSVRDLIACESESMTEEFIVDKMVHLQIFFIFFPLSYICPKKSVKIKKNMALWTINAYCFDSSVSYLNTQ